MSGLILHFSEFHFLIYKMELIVISTSKIFMRMKFNNVYKDVYVFRAVLTQMLHLIIIIRSGLELGFPVWCFFHCFFSSFIHPFICLITIQGLFLRVPQPQFCSSICSWFRYWQRFPWDQTSVLST